MSPSKRVLGAVVLAGALFGTAASVFHFSAAPAGFTGPFGGAGESNLGDTCGAADSCAAVSYTSTLTDGGVGFTCTGAGNCVDLGTGTCNTIGTDSNGYVRVGGLPPCQTHLIMGDSTDMASGLLTISNGSVSLNGTTYLQNASAAVIVNDTDGLLLTPQAATPSCASGNKGTFSTLTDGGAAYYCNGTLAQPIGYTLSATSNIDFASMNSQATDSKTLTVTGATTADAVFCTPVNGGSMSGTDMHPTVTAADTVTIVAHNDTNGTVDPPAMDIKCVVVR